MYYKDDTHYFVMTAKKQSLLEKGVILQVPTHMMMSCIKLTGNLTPTLDPNPQGSHLWRNAVFLVFSNLAD